MVFFELLFMLKVSINEKRFRAATSYIFLSYGPFRTAFILLALSGMVSFFSKLLISFRMEELGLLGMVVYYALLVLSLMLMLTILYGRTRKE